MGTAQDLPTVQAKDRRAWRNWLATHHASAPGAWLRFAKKGSPGRTVTYGEAIEEALCFGWIDGQVRRLDEHFYLQRFTPRRKASQWSQINREKATRLIEEGRMHSSGLAHIEAARADGRWDAAYPAQSQAAIPEDFQRALDDNPDAARFFATLTGSTRYAFLYRLHNVRTPQARERRIAAYIERLNAGRTLES